MNDIGHALRLLARNRLFAAVSITTIAVGIGATTLMLSIANAALLRPLPIADPSEVVTVRELRDGALRSNFSLRQYLDYRDRSTVFSGTIAYNLDELSLRTVEGARVVPAYAVSGSYFATLGLRPAAGRLLRPDDDGADGAAPVVVISHDFWRDRFDADPSVLGRATITLNGQTLTVVGVAPEGFRGTFIGLSAIAWFPLSLYTTLHPGAAIHDGDDHVFLNVAGRLMAGTTRARAEAALALTGAQRARLRAAEPAVEGVHLERMSGLPPGARRAVTGFVLLLLVAAGLLLAISSVNVAGMLLARATARGREIALRVAVGASRGRIVRQLLVESLVLFALGGIAGVLLAAWGADLLESVRPPLPVHIHVDLGLDGRVLALTSLVTMLTGVVFGLAPAAHAARPGALAVLGRSPSAGTPSRLQPALVAGQVALSLVLLISAALFGRALRRAVSIDPGFDARGVAVASFDLRPHGYDAAHASAFETALLESLRARPDVESAALSDVVPLGFGSQTAQVTMDGVMPPPGEAGWTIDYDAVTPGYLETVRIPVIAGRGFLESDGPTAPRVAIINETMARRWWPRGDALGATVTRAGSNFRIVGIARDADYNALGEEPRPYMYVAFAQSPSAHATVSVRSAAGDAGAVLAAIQSDIALLDPDVPMIDARPLEQVVDIATFPQRTAAAFVGAFGIIGLLLAAVGIHGVLAFAVGMRTREIGIRMALGATSADVVAMVARQGFRLVLTGSAIGIVAALALTRLLASVLYGVHPADPISYVAVTALLFTTGVLAALAPAARAARIDPLDAIRTD